MQTVPVEALIPTGQSSIDMLNSLKGRDCLRPSTLEPDR